LVVVEGVQKITVHPVEGEGTLGEAVVSPAIRPEVEGVRIVVARVVLVSLVGIPIMLGFWKLFGCLPNKERMSFSLSHIRLEKKSCLDSKHLILKGVLKVTILLPIQ